jgi:hypothetical protein
MPSRERRASHGVEGNDDDGTASNGVTSGTGSRPLRAGLDSLSRRSADVRKRLDGWSATIIKQTRANPGRSVALALGAGYVLGGGLFTGLTARLLGAALRIGIRVAVVPLVTDSIAALGGGLLGHESGAATEDDSAEAAQH